MYNVIKVLPSCTLVHTPTFSIQILDYKGTWKQKRKLVWWCCAGAVICTVFPEEEKERQRLQLLAPTTNNVVVYYTLRTFFQGEFVCHIGGQLLMIYGTPDSFLYHSVYRKTHPAILYYSCWQNAICFPVILFSPIHKNNGSQPIHTRNHFDL